MIHKIDMESEEMGSSMHACTGLYNRKWMESSFDTLSLLCAVGFEVSAAF